MRSATRFGKFPFLFGGAFIEAEIVAGSNLRQLNFPSFLEGLSLRPSCWVACICRARISLPFWRGFH